MSTNHYICAYFCVLLRNLIIAKFLGKHTLNLFTIQSFNFHACRNVECTSEIFFVSVRFNFHIYRNKWNFPLPVLQQKNSLLFSTQLGARLDNVQPLNRARRITRPLWSLAHQSLFHSLRTPFWQIHRWYFYSSSLYSSSSTYETLISKYKLRIVFLDINDSFIVI